VRIFLRRVRAICVVICAGGLLGGASAAGAKGATAVPSDSASVRPEPDSTRVYALPPIDVIGSFEDSLARRSAASQGVVTPTQIARRPLLRAGDALETVPGLLISQHSGEGKANQYYLRGFNLDHGTDFATTIEGVPVNMPTHAHGQGYTDLNFVIPELVSGIDYRKGTYSAEDGDFSSAGSARISYRHTLASPMVSLTAGDEGYRRILVGLSPALPSGSLLGAIELLRNDGPWVHPDDYQKLNGLIRYDNGGPERRLSAIAMGYDGRWNSTDQIPKRAIAAGTTSRFGAIDPSDGGTSYRYSLTTEFQEVAPRSRTRVSAYILAYDVDLFSNFTYFLNDTLNGDQIEQADQRVVTGLNVSHVDVRGSPDREVQQMIGLDIRSDNIASVGLFHTRERLRLSTIREDQISEQSASPYVQSDAQWLSHLRSIVGLRADLYHFNLTSSHQPFSGSDVTGIVSPKASLIIGPWGGFNLYVNGGYGFHSDDVRGATFTPSAAATGVEEAPEHFPVQGGPPVERTPLLVRTKGAEVGAHLARGFGWSTSATLWGLDIDSEHLFQGDAATTEPSRPSRRTGVEVSGECGPVERLHLDADLAYSRARFTDSDPVGNHIPGAVEGVASAGVGYQQPAGGFAELRLRYFGPRPLIENNSVRSNPSTILNAQLGCRVHANWTVAIEIFNLLDRAVSDVDYYYTSRLPGEPLQGIADVHTHPQGPRSFRLAVSSGVLH
jgi:TonB dependent receptor/TonB-dependent Receptor Plug Domain